MSGDERFLARWSRRKRRAARPPHERPRPVAADHAKGAEPAGSAIPPGEPPPPPDLPPLDAIGADTDIRAFLAAGVPADLTRAALRRAWSADPTIRDFIGLSENSWDFTAAAGVPGFGDIGADEVRRLLDGAPPETATGPDEPAAAPADAASGPPPAPPPPAPPPPAEAKLAALPENQPAKPPRRGHGGALPK
jgi:hypothetical protein